MNSDIDTAEAKQYVANARAMLSDFEECSIEEKRGAIHHAINELQNAKRSMPSDMEIAQMTENVRDSDDNSAGDSRE